MPGGLYRLCWCRDVSPEIANSTNSSVSYCSTASGLIVDAGEMRVLGIKPMGSQHRTCTAGLPCTLAGITGDVSQRDRLLIFDTCGTEAVVPGFPDSAVSSATGDWLTVTWGSIAVTAAAGRYRLCWCSGADDLELPNSTSNACSLLTSFNIDVGEFTLTGFAPLEQHRTCVSGRMCAFNSISGIGLSGDEQFVALDTCGSQDTVRGFPDAGFARNWSAQGRLDWGSEVLSASGGTYRLCVCALGTACNSQVDYALDIGALWVQGPHKFQDRTCIAGQFCDLSAVYGTFLSPSDSFAILDTCGHNLVAGFPFDSLLVTQPSTGVVLVSWGDQRVTSAGGDYRLCWCASTGNSSLESLEPLSTTCGGLSEYRTDLGRMMVIGPAPLQQGQTCVSGQTCIFDAPAGHLVSELDTFQILDTCGFEGSLPGFPSSIPQVDFTRGSPSLTWAIPVTAYGGLYRICWCATGLSCSSAEDFELDAGELLLIGPRPLVQQRTCTSMPCNITGLSGMYLSSADLVMLLDTCGQSATSQDAAVGFLGLAVGVTASGRGIAEVEGSLYNLQFHMAGGVYRLCWCAGGYSCSSHEDFQVDIGELLVSGATTFGQHRTCVSGQTCLWSGINLWPDTTTGNRLIVLDTCSMDAARAPLPNSAVLPYVTVEQAALTENAVLQASWGADRLSGSGGTYRACWCDSDCPAVEGSFFMDLATITVVGPSPLHQQRTGAHLCLVCLHLLNLRVRRQCAVFCETDVCINHHIY